MKKSLVQFTGLFLVFLFVMSGVIAQETDDMYFRKSDRKPSKGLFSKKNKTIDVTATETVSSQNATQKPEETSKSTVVYETVSAKNINPDFVQTTVGESDLDSDSSGYAYFEEQNVIPNYTYSTPTTTTPTYYNSNLPSTNFNNPCYSSGYNPNRFLGSGFGINTAFIFGNNSFYSPYGYGSRYGYGNYNPYYNSRYNGSGSYTQNDNYNGRPVSVGSRNTRSSQFSQNNSPSTASTSNRSIRSNRNTSAVPASSLRTSRVNSGSMQPTKSTRGSLSSRSANRMSSENVRATRKSFGSSKSSIFSSPSSTRSRSSATQGKSRSSRSSGFSSPSRSRSSRSSSGTRSSGRSRSNRGGQK